MSIDEVVAALSLIDNGLATTGIYSSKDCQIVDDVQKQVIGLLKFGNIPENFDTGNKPEVARKSMELILA